MVDENFSWFYLIFFLIPLARLLPRLVRKWKKKNDSFTQSQFSQSNPGTDQRQESFEKSPSFVKPQNKEMQVLGDLNTGTRDFNKIQKNLGINNQELEDILKDLEKQGLMKVVKKSGPFGVKVKLVPTEKGFKKYYS